MPIAFVGAACLLLARSHIEKDSARVFEAVASAMAANEAEEAAHLAADAAVRLSDHDVDAVGGTEGET
jgi:hypothetical protein